jgi:hypothetical protein
MLQCLDEVNKTRDVSVLKTDKTEIILEVPSYHIYVHLACLLFSIRDSERHLKSPDLWQLLDPVPAFLTAGLLIQNSKSYSIEACFQTCKSPSLHWRLQQHRNIGFHICSMFEGGKASSSMTLDGPSQMKEHEGAGWHASPTLRRMLIGRTSNHR